MPHYRVTWTYDDVDAETPEDAARWCLARIRAADSVVTCFTVVNLWTDEITVIDVGDPDHATIYP